MAASRLVATLVVSGVIFLPSLLIPRDSHAQNVPPVVSNVVATQIAGTGNVRVTYDLADANSDSCYARLYISSNNGVSFDLVPVTMTGDVNKNIFPGNGKQIIWNAAGDYPGRYWAQVVAKVFVSDGVAAGGEMVYVAAGPYPMGYYTTNDPNSDMSPVHTVTLSGFYCDKYEVTNAEYKVFIDAGGYSTQEYWGVAGWTWKTTNSITQPLYWVSGDNNSGPSYPGYPVVGVSWYEAEAYSHFVGKRLPTEAEWERAARGSDSRLFPWGSTIDPSRANYASAGAYFQASSPTGFYDGRTTPYLTTNSPSPIGAYDLSGNVREWVSDWYSNTYYATSPGTNPPGPVSGTEKSCRGGAFDDPVQPSPWTQTSAGTCVNRRQISPTTRGANLGFRCAKSQ